MEKYYNKNISYIIFHEGNICEKHQEYIQFNTVIPLKFIDVSRSFRKKQVNIYPPTRHFSLGYRNMCNFWFCDFWNYLTKYSKIMRIDEDCLYYSDYNEVFDILKNKEVVYGKWDHDKAYVTRNLQYFTIFFMINHKKIPIKNKVGGPYTNVIGFNLDKLRNNTILTKYIKFIKKSNYIYVYRWGDLPLWGEALTYCLSDKNYKQTNKIQYYHGSHDVNVNI